MTQAERLFNGQQEQEEFLDPFRFSTEAEGKWYWHSLYFRTPGEAQQAKHYITAQYDVCCTTPPCGSNEYEVSFSTNYELDDVFRTHLLMNMGVSPTATLFNEESSEAVPDINALEDILHWLRCAAYIACGTVLGILSLPLIFIAFLIALVMLLFKHALD